MNNNWIKKHETKWHNFIFIIFCATLCTSLYYVKGTPAKEQVRELCGRSNVIPNPTKYKGRLLEKPTFKHIEKKYYEYETGFPLTGDKYTIKAKF